MGVTKSDKEYIGRDFTTGNINKQLVLFSLPFLLASLLSSLYNTVDMIIIGQFVGSVGTVAVSLGGRCMDLLTMVGQGFAGGGQVLISQQVGAKKREELNATIGTMFSLLLVLSVVSGGMCFLFCDTILRWLNTPEEAMAAATAYLKITSVGMPLIFGYHSVASVLRGMGDSKSPLIFIAIAAVLNLILDVVFIVFFGLGAVGTALATVIGQGLSLVCSLVVLYRRREAFGFDFKLKSFAIDWQKLKIIVNIGLPLAARSVFIGGTQMFVVSFVNDYGLAQAAAYSIGTKITNLLNVVNSSMRQASGSMVGQNVGAGDYDRIRKIVRATFLFGVASAAFFSALSLLFPRQIFRLFTDDPEVMAYAVSFMAITCVLFWLSAFLGPLEGVVTGIGNGRLSFLMGVLDGVVCRLAFSFFFGVTLHMEAAGFFLGNSMGKSGPLIVDSIYYFSGKWKKYKKLV